MPRQGRWPNPSSYKAQPADPIKSKVQTSRIALVERLTIGSRCGSASFFTRDSDSATFYDSLVYRKIHWCLSNLNKNFNVRNLNPRHSRLSLCSLSLWERVGERACAPQASHPPLTPPRGRGINHAR